MQTFDTSGSTPSSDSSPALNVVGGDAGGSNGAENSTDTQINDTQSVEAGTTGADGATETGQIEGDAGPENGAPETEAVGPESGLEDKPAPFDPKAFRQELVEELKEKLAPPPQPVQLTDEQWALKEQEYGMPRQAIHAMTRQNVQIVQTLRQEFAQMLDQRFARIEKDSAITGMSSKYPDISRYKSGIDEHLAKFDPRLHNNPQVIEDAYWIAKAKALAASNTKKPATPMKIAGTPRPASPGGARKPSAPGLSAVQRDVAAKYGMSEAEYAKHKVGPGKSVVFG